jgi:DNA repair protein RecN (Recombination protein N)
MLKSFHVKDYALIEQLDVEFGKGLNIITGETGAGKSILIDAMSLLLGERASAEVIRKGSLKAIVEGIFELSSNKNVADILSLNEIDILDQLIMRRELSAKGNNRCFVNDTPVALNLFRELGNLLVDLHGQHEHQSLLRTETHIDFLDQYSDISILYDEYKKQYDHLHKLLTALKQLILKEKDIKERKDFYSFQIKEIDAVNPHIEEENELNSDLKILENSEELLGLTAEAYRLLYDSENAVYDKLVKVKQMLSDLNKIDSVFNEVNEECETSVSLINDISEFIRSYNSKVSLEPQKLEEIRERLSALNLLKKKYGGSIKSLLDYRKKIGEEVLLAENFEDRINELTNEINIYRDKCGNAAEKLSLKRIKSAAK